MTPAVDITPDARALFDKLRTETLGALDPADPSHPVAASEVKALIERVEKGLPK